MKNALLHGLILFLTFLGNIAFAVKVDSLYTGEIAVQSQAPEERRKATQMALAQVLIKVSGKKQILDNPRVKQHLTKASSLARQFGYTRHNTHYLLQVQFDIDGVNQCLQDANAPIWGQNRPLILGWINDESIKLPEAADPQIPNTVNDLVKIAMEKRGIPLAYPTPTTSSPDITELNNLGKRQKTDALLIGHISKNADMLNSQWKLTLNKDQWEWNIVGNTLNDIIPVLVDHVAATLSDHFAVVTSSHIQKNIFLKVTGIKHQSDFTQLIRYLNHLTPVANVSISNINGTNVLLNVSLRSTEESFLQAVSLGQKLSITPQDPSISPLIFHWNHSS